MSAAIAKRLCITILLLYLAVGALFARFTPAWQAPDEPAHYNYIRQVAEAGCCPRIEPGDWSSAYLTQLTSSRFAPEWLGELDSVQYEDHQPPLYYLLASLVFRLSEGDLLALRLFSVALGAGTALLSYCVCRRVLPGKPQMALAVLSLVAFLPQHLHIAGAVNNDALAELLAGLALLWLLRYLDAGDQPLWQLGVIIGMAFLSKLTVYFLLPLALLAVWLRWRRGDKPISVLLRRLLTVLLVAGAIGGIWWLRNISVYGLPDFLGLGAHDGVVAGQPRSAEYIAEHGALAYLGEMATTSFKSFWGQFGWMALPLDDVLGGWLYRGFLVVMLAGVSGVVLAGRGAIKLERWALLLAVIGMVALQFGYYNLEFQQWQGRYFYPALLPIAILLVHGLDFWLERVLPGRAWAHWLLPLGMLALAALDVYLLFRVIAPGLSPG